MSGRNKKALSIERPDLLESWDYDKNRDICSPDNVSVGSHTKVWWRCDKGHTWKTEIRDRVRGSGCPYCSKKRIWPGFNDLASLRPDLLCEWDYERNKQSPHNVGIGNYKACWICSRCGHSWEATIASRVRGTGCPKCGQEKRQISKRTADYNKSFAKAFPELLKDWDYEKNTDVNPRTVYPSSKKKTWWKCNKCGNGYYAAICSRANGTGCPICAGKIVVHGQNDLQTWCESNNMRFILEEWDYNKNRISPRDVTPFTSRKAWFICKEGHSFYAAISNRTSNGTGCPICEKGRKTSFPEQAVYYYIKKSFPSSINSFRATWLGQLELDIYIPELKIAVEYDGATWHVDKKKDIKKNTLCLENGIRLIRIRESGLGILEHCTNICLDGFSNNSLNAAIIRILHELGCDSYDIDVDRDTPSIVQQFDNKKKERSIMARFPELLAEWDYDKNAGVDPLLVNYGSMRKFWWKCSICNYSWQMSPNSRTNQGQGCPNCAGTKRALGKMDSIIRSSGSFEESSHFTLDEWDYETNSILPSQVTRYSKKKVWWKCKTCGGRWQATIQNRTKEKGTGCPYCSGRKVLKGFNDIRTIRPELLLEWDNERNTDLLPDMFTVGSSKKVWWKCSICGHEWKATISSRTQGRKCPICQRKSVATKQQVRVMNLDTGDIFDSMSKAAESCNGSSGSICSCCKGKQKTAYGFRWGYVNANSEGKR